MIKLVDQDDIISPDQQLNIIQRIEQYLLTLCFVDMDNVPYTLQWEGGISAIHIFPVQDK